MSLVFCPLLNLFLHFPILRPLPREPPSLVSSFFFSLYFFTAVSFFLLLLLLPQEKNVSYIYPRPSIFYVELTHFLRLCDIDDIIFCSVISIYVSSYSFIQHHFLRFCLFLVIFQVLLSGDLLLSHLFDLFQPFFLHSHPNNVMYV